MAKIGLFDSGIGGRSIEGEIKSLLPGIQTIYLSDSKNFPYGTKTPDELKKIAVKNTEYLLKKGATLIVVACNTATVNTISHLRKIFPKVSFVGVEPAVKPAGIVSRKGIIILSSPKATKSKQLSDLIKKFAKGKKVLNLGSLDLVVAVEKGFSRNKVFEILEKDLPKRVLPDYDVLVLGCTHFPIISKWIKEYVGDSVSVIDSGAAVALRVKNLIQ